jgi:predicted ATPase
VRGQTLLLIVDNCEHQVDACAEIIDVLLDASSAVRVLATSREALRVPGEVAFRVPSLEDPETGSPSIHTTCWTTLRCDCSAIACVKSMLTSCSQLKLSLRWQTSAAGYLPLRQMSRALHAHGACISVSIRSQVRRSDT